MVTNSERQEIVRSLRRGVSYMFLVKRWRNGGLDRVQTFSEYLADWIERPTCRNLAKPRGMAPVETGDWFECSECHCKARQNAIGMVVRHCPNCGAEVVE